MATHPKTTAATTTVFATILNLNGQPFQPGSPAPVLRRTVSGRLYVHNGPAGTGELYSTTTSEPQLRASFAPRGHFTPSCSSITEDEAVPNAEISGRPGRKVILSNARPPRLSPTTVSRQDTTSFVNVPASSGSASASTAARRGADVQGTAIRTQRSVSAIAESLLLVAEALDSDSDSKSDSETIRAPSRMTSKQSVRTLRRTRAFSSASLQTELDSTEATVVRDGDGDGDRGDLWCELGSASWFSMSEGR